MSSILLFLLHLLVAFLAVASLLAILFPRRPLLGVPQHWGLQLWQLGLIALIGSLLLSDWIAAALSLAAAAYWSWRLWPRKAAPDLKEGEPLLRLASANLLYHNIDFARMVDGMKATEADVLVLCEVTPEARGHLRILETGFPHALDTCAPDNLYGIVILSRFPLMLRSGGIGEDALPRHLAADLAIDGHVITLVAIHPTNPLRLSDTHRIPAEFESVADLVRRAPDDLILIGDCNATGWSSSLQDLERKTGLTNDRKVRPSWPVWLPPLVRLPLDHVWVRGRVTLLRAELGQRFGSDHLPLIAEIGWRGQ
jgi:endonuclease/exonuclease/phosphatase (EEP) superfamily protein YafD